MNKHHEKAERLRQNGKLEAALEEYLIARKEEPGNDAIVVAAAETYQSLNRPLESRQSYAYLFDKYAEKQDAEKTLEYFRRLQKLGPPDAKRLMTCARLLEKQRPRDAIVFFTQALQSPGGKDPGVELQCLEGLAALQPESLELQQRIADLASKSGKRDIAAAAYTRQAEILLSQKNFPESADALENAFQVSGESASARMALALASLRAKRFGRVLELLASQEETANAEVLNLLAEAYYAEKLFPKAEAAYWKLAESSPAAFTALTDLAIEYLSQQNPSAALPLLKKLDEQLTSAKWQSKLITLADKLSHVENPGIEVLEFLCSMADRLHLDNPFEKALDGLFGLYFADGEFEKATDCLERLVDVDSYGADRSVKLRQLEGKADAAIWNELAARLGQTPTAPKSAAPASATHSTATPPPSNEKPGGPVTTAGALGDLILQAEIFLQYKLMDKARERLERIARQFPGEEKRNPELRQLYERAGFVPQVAAAKPVAASVVETQTDWTRMAEIIRNLSRQRTVKGVLSAAVNGIGRLWQASRCVAGLATPKHPPTLALEYISPGIPSSDAAMLGKLIMGLQTLTEEQNSALVADKASEVKRLAPLHAMLTALQIESLVAIPVREEDQPSGILVLEQCGTSRSWSPNDVAALEVLADQIGLASSNARMRALMRTLAVTDERSGLLQRDSYLTCLLSEAERMREQQTPLAAAILQFAAPVPAGAKRNDEALEAFLQQFRSTFASHLRQNDIPLKYGPSSLAVILPATTAKQAALMVEKIRKLAAASPLPDSGTPPSMAAGIAEAVMDANMDSTDIVTELINRVESALSESSVNGIASTKVLEPPSLSR